MIQVPYNGTARILTLQPSKEEGTVRLVCVYAPTLQSPPEVKDQFYESLDTVIGMVPSSDHILLLGDFNARVGADRESWPSVVGHHGIGKMNENDQTLLELCCYHNLYGTNTFFQNKAYHKVSWRHPRSKHWHQPDLVITRWASLNNVCNTRSYHSADCNIDHSLIYYSKKKGQPRINTSKTAYSDKIQKFAERLEESLMYHHEQSAEDRWSSLRNTIYSVALLIFGKKVQTTGFNSQRESCKPLSPVISGNQGQVCGHQASNRINTVSQDALDAIEDLPVLEELDAETTMEELSKTIDALASGKAPGEDGIPPEIIKCGKSALLQPLHELLCLCWSEEKHSEERVYLHTRSDGKLFSPYRLKAKAEVQTVLFREMLFADDAGPDRSHRGRTSTPYQQVCLFLRGIRPDN
ncbi:uncharacterized protein [Montipora capricornis]|uniref:uncharacterized protein n=1 Tax=Montipora capricornis TaxID=246305 RepID=UPI0035F12351